MMKIIKIGFIVSAVAMLLINCKTAAQNSNIESVTLRNTFGRGGHTMITATKDSLSSSSAGGRVTDFPNFNKKINSKDWQKLVSGINISTLDKTKSGERRGHYDGPDQIFVIKTAEKEYEFYNVPEESEGYKQLEQLKTELDNILIQYKK